MTLQSAGPLNWQSPIVDKFGRPTPEFIRYFQSLIKNDGTLDAGKQNADADLTAISALIGTGIAARISNDTWALRSIAAPASGITVTNPAGIAGNPTIGLANDLAALEALTGTNTIYYRSGADTWSPVTIGTGLTFVGGTLSGSAAYTDEMARDAIGLALVAGTGISIAVNDVADTITIASTVTATKQVLPVTVGVSPVEFISDADGNLIYSEIS